MEIKLKSILSRIPLWLACRALLLGAAWYFLPFWIFFLLANYFYWVPFFEVKAFLAPFLLTLMLAGVSAPSWGWAGGVAAIFFFILGGKEFAFIQRTRFFGILSACLLCAWVLALGILTEGTKTFSLPLSYFFAGLLFFALRESNRRYALRNEAETETSGTVRAGGGGRSHILESAVGALLFWEYSSAVGGLPLELAAKDAALLAGALGFFFLPPFSGREFPRRKFARYAGALAGAVFIILTTARWTL